MKSLPPYRQTSQTRDDIEALAGPVLLEFGANWCGICKGFEPELAELIEDHPEVRHIRVEDGPGRALGRSFRVKLWPNLVFLRDGNVLRQLARPSREEAKQALDELLVGR